MRCASARCALDAFTLCSDAACVPLQLRALMLQRQNLLRGHEETVAEAQAGIAAVDTARAGARAASLRQRGKHATVSAAQASLGERSRASQRAGVDSVWRDGDSLGGTVPPRPMRESFKGDANWFSGRSAGDRGTIDIGSLDDADMREPSTSSSSVPRRVAKPAAVPDNVRLTESGRRVYLGRTKERLARLKKRNDQRITAKRERAAVTVPTDGADETKAGSGSGGEVERDGVRDKREGAAPGADGGETASPKPAVAAVGPVQAGRGDDDHRRGAVTRGGTDIHTFLSSVGMTQYTAALEAEALVDVNLLTDMAADPRGLRDALREAGVAKVGHREKIALALQQRHEAAEKRRAKQRGADDSE